MTNIEFNTIDDFADIEAVNMYKERIAAGCDRESVLRSLRAKARDNARTPMQWNNSENAGFTQSKPWYRVNPNYSQINVENALADENSVFYCYQKLIKLRRENPIMVYGDYALLLPDDENIYALVDTYDGVATAIKNAKRRMAKFDEEKDKPSSYDPGTTVYQLVEQLKQFLE